MLPPTLPPHLPPQLIAHHVQQALAEDRADADITVASVIDPAWQVGLELRAREPLVVAGMALAKASFQALTANLHWKPQVEDGQQVPAGALLASLNGQAAGLLSAERTALNFLQHLSGIATLTRHYVQAVAGTGATILDTRKTIPGLRALAKYATLMGGAQNHRQNLADGLMLKDNHIALIQSDADGASLAQTLHQIAAMPPLPSAAVVECDHLDQVALCLANRIPHLLLDNMTLAQLKQAVALRNQTAAQAGGYRAKLEASGGVRLETIRAIAETGVDHISVGRLTMSAPSVDIGLDWPSTPA
jgi:nicotinate-nucleotide pyrophosphorylase (carboxylating)